MDIEKELKLLNPQQLEAVLYNTSHLLILAGAGSGKTRVITVKIAYLVQESGIDPASILAVTFTNKAAEEMRNRAAMLAPAASRITMRTFHSFGAYLLRLYADHLGLERNFTICDDTDSLSVLQELFPDQSRAVLTQYARSIAHAKDNCLFPDSPEEDLRRINIHSSFPEVYRMYQDFIRRTGNVDFGDLMLYPLQLLREHTDVQTSLQSRYRYIFVDEYQDSNKAQFELLRHLTGKENTICVVGDDDQSIYRFRGAELRNILDFPQYFHNTKTVCLEQNYRSTAEILLVADTVVRNNQNRYDKKLFSKRTGGIKPQLYLHRDELEEARFCTAYVRKHRDSPGLTAILYRTNAQSRVFESELVRAGISYRIIGSMQFWQREEIKDMLAYLSILFNPRDLISFRRISRKFIDAFGAASFEKISEYMEKHPDSTIFTALEIFSASKRQTAGIQNFLRLYKDMQEDCLLSDRIAQLIELSGIVDYYKKKDPERSSARIENLDELVHAAYHYGNGVEELQRFLESAELHRQESNSQNSETVPVVLITMHSTKGLEFDRVIITGMEDAIFPGNCSTDEVEDERRLFYVAITRAKNELLLSSCERRFLHRSLESLSPSRFLAEIPEEKIEIHHCKKQKEWNRAFTKTRGVWSGGMAVQHQTYGFGKVVDVVQAGKRELIIVRFDDGKFRQFLPEYAHQLRVQS